VRIVLHIGTDKAGSTAIQYHMNANRDWLLARSVYIPETGFGTGNGHALLFQDKLADARVLLVAELRRAQAAGYGQALLSWEGLHSWRWLRLRGLRRLFSGFELVPLIYLREQADVIQSGFLQELKKLDNRLSIDVVAQRWPTWQHIRHLNARYPMIRHYDRVLARWQRWVRPADMLVRRYDAGTWPNGNLLDDVLAQLQLTADGEFQRLHSDGNISLDAESATLIDQWRRSGTSRQTLRRLVDIALSRIADQGPGNKYFLDAEAVSALRRYYRASNSRWARRYLDLDADPFGNPFGNPFGSPFNPVNDARACCRNGEPEQGHRSLEPVSAAITELDRVPTFEGPAEYGRSIARTVALPGGWSKAEDWGLWSDAPLSTIRFRLYRQHLTPFHRQLRLYLCGRYFADNTLTGLRVNGQLLGEFALGHGQPGIDLPLTLLHRFEVLNIELLHQSPISPRSRDGADDDREIAYGLESIGYDLL
jgi:hypothetical protein